MPFDSASVGRSTAPIDHQVDARWLMAYAAALDDLNPRYMDTHRGLVMAHPLFPVCVEWPAILATRSILGNMLSADEAARGVHAAHDLHLYAPIQAGDELRTIATMIGAQTIKPGTAYTMRLDTRRAHSDELVARTYQLGIYRGVDISGKNQPAENLPELPALSPPSAVSRTIPIARGAAHTYTECAQIWNPIHTDTQIAIAAGLPDIILHGTATMALAVSRIVEQFADGDPQRVTRIGGRFTAMVLMPSTITVNMSGDGGVVSYNVLNAQGELAISQGYVCLR